MLKGLACGGTPALAMNGHMLKLASGGCLNLNELPPQEGVTLEMLQACRDRIFLLESQAAAAGPVTPSKVARGPARPHPALRR
jgi:hypothetical protein